MKAPYDATVKLNETKNVGFGGRSCRGIGDLALCAGESHSNWTQPVRYACRIPSASRFPGLQ